MTTFDEREKAFENKYQHDQELLFRIQARRAKLVGLWAAEQLGLTGREAEAYARQVIDAELDRPAHQAMLRKIHGDLFRKGVDISEHRVEKELERLLEVAKQQVVSE